MTIVMLLPEYCIDMGMSVVIIMLPEYCLDYGHDYAHCILPLLWNLPLLTDSLNSG